MSADNLRRRVLLAASPSSTKPMQQLFSQTPLDAWEPIQAESFLQARFILQHQACEVALVHEDLYHREGGQSLAWFGREPLVPIVFLTSYRAETMTQAYAQGVTLCLPRDLSFAQPELLATALDRAVREISSCSLSSVCRCENQLVFGSMGKVRQSKLTRRSMCRAQDAAGTGSRLSQPGSRLRHPNRPGENFQRGSGE